MASGQGVTQEDWIDKRYESSVVARAGAALGQFYSCEEPSLSREEGAVERRRLGVKGQNRVLVKVTMEYITASTVDPVYIEEGA